MPCSHCKMEIDHCWIFCSAWNMIVNSLNVPVILWSLTSSSLRYFSVPQKSQSVRLNLSLGLFKSLIKNLGKKWTAGWWKRDKIIGLFCQWSIPQVDLWRWVALCIITLLMLGRRVRYTHGQHWNKAHCEQQRGRFWHWPEGIHQTLLAFTC